MAVVREVVAAGLSPLEVSACKTIVDWTPAFLCSPHAELGREEPVCLFTLPSINQRLRRLCGINARRARDASDRKISRTATSKESEVTASRVSLGPISRSCPIARKLSSKPACTPNVERKLISCSVSYRLHRHCEFARPIRNPLDFARQLKYDLARITKTLLVRLPDGPPYALVTAPVGKRVNFSALARERGVKRLEIRLRNFRNFNLKVANFIAQKIGLLRETSVWPPH